jgi:DNA-binding response OmpR family regulator
VSGSKRILVADDSETVTTLLRTALQTEGFVVEVAQNGLEAYEMGKRGSFDLVVLDQLMPGLLGVEIIQRWHEDGVDTPVLMLSGVDDDRTVVESLESGAIDFVRKPFRMPEMLARIRQRLKD